MTEIGQRLDDQTEWNPNVPRCTYWKYTTDDQKTLWHYVTPYGDVGVIDPTEHTVIEHANGVITIMPSILLSERQLFHGSLINGIWVW